MAPALTPRNYLTSSIAFTGAISLANKVAGLGLAIARSIVEAHGGNITAKSVQDNGAVFIISFPET